MQRDESRYHWQLSKKEVILLSPIFAVMAVGSGIKHIGKSIKNIFKKKEK